MKVFDSDGPRLRVVFVQVFGDVLQDDLVLEEVVSLLRGKQQREDRLAALFDRAARRHDDEIAHDRRRHGSQPRGVVGRRRGDGGQPEVALNHVQHPGNESLDGRQRGESRFGSVLILSASGGTTACPGLIGPSGRVVVVRPREGVLRLAVDLHAVHEADAAGVEGGPEHDREPLVGLQTLVPGEGDVEPAAPGHRGRDAAAKDLDVARHPRGVLGPEVDPDAHHDLVGVVVGDLEREPGRLRVGDVHPAGVQPRLDLLHVVDLEEVVAAELDIVDRGAALEEVDRKHDVGRRPHAVVRLHVLFPPRRLQGHHARDREHSLRDPEVGALVAAHENLQTSVLAQQDQGGLGFWLLRLLMVVIPVADGHAVDDLGLGPDPDLLDRHRFRVDHDHHGVVGDLLEGGDEAGVIGYFPPLHERLVGGSGGRGGCGGSGRCAAGLRPTP